MSLLKRLLLVLSVAAGLLGMHAVAGLQAPAPHAHAAAHLMHDGVVLHGGGGSPSEQTPPCDSPAPCHTMAGAGSGCIPLPGGQAPALVAPDRLRVVMVGWLRVHEGPGPVRDRVGPSLVELCISRT